MGQLAFADSAHVYIDAVTVIYAVEQTPTYGVLLNPLWNNLQAGNLEVFTSELTLMETLVVPLRNSDTFLVDAYERLLRSPQMQLILISQTVLHRSSKATRHQAFVENTRCHSCRNRNIFRLYPVSYQRSTIEDSHRLTCCDSR